MIFYDRGPFETKLIVLDDHDELFHHHDHIFKLRHFLRLLVTFLISVTF